MTHRTQDTYSLTNFREKTGEHLARLAEGRIETITQNGVAAMVVMSPGRYDFLVHAAERGHVWKAALDRLEAGDTGAHGPANQTGRVHRLKEEVAVQDHLRPGPQRLHAPTRDRMRRLSASGAQLVRNPRPPVALVTRAVRNLLSHVALG